jgi:hypothetical protein
MGRGEADHLGAGRPCMRTLSFRVSEKRDPYSFKPRPSQSLSYIMECGWWLTSLVSGVIGLREQS